MFQCSLRPRKSKFLSPCVHKPEQTPLTEANINIWCVLLNSRRLFLLHMLPAILAVAGPGCCLPVGSSPGGAGLWSRAGHVLVAYSLPLRLSAGFAFPSCWLPSLPWLLVKTSPLPCRTPGGTSGSSVSLLMLLATRVLWCRDSSSSSTSREGITWRQVRARTSLPHPASL